MDVSRMIAEIDAKIASLQQARTVLLGLDESTPAPVKAKRGRPKGSTNASKTAQAATKSVTKPAAPAKRKRNLSPEGRKRIADAMKRRWAERRSAPAKAVKK